MFSNASTNEMDLINDVVRINLTRLVTDLLCKCDLVQINVTPYPC